MPVITIDWFEGRSADQKREIAEQITDVIVDVGKTPRDHVWIRFNDTSRGDWAIAGEIQGAPSEPPLGPPD